MIDIWRLELKLHPIRRQVVVRELKKSAVVDGASSLSCRFKIAELCRKLRNFNYGCPRRWVKRRNITVNDTRYSDRQYEMERRNGDLGSAIPGGAASWPTVVDIPTKLLDSRGQSPPAVATTRRHQYRSRCTGSCSWVSFHVGSVSRTIVILGLRLCLSNFKV